MTKAQVLKNYNLTDMVRLSGDVVEEPWRDGHILYDMNGVAVVARIEPRGGGAYLCVVVYNGITGSPFSFANTNFVATDNVEAIALQMQQIAIRVCELRDTGWTVRRCRAEFSNRPFGVVEKAYENRYEGFNAGKNCSYQTLVNRLAQSARQLNALNAPHSGASGEDAEAITTRIGFLKLEIARNEEARRLSWLGNSNSSAVESSPDVSTPQKDIDSDSFEMELGGSHADWRPWGEGSIVYSNGPYALVVSSKSRNDMTKLMVIRKRHSGRGVCLVLSTGQIKGKHLRDTTRKLHKIILRLVAMEEGGWSIKSGDEDTYSSDKAKPGLLFSPSGNRQLKFFACNVFSGRGKVAVLLDKLMKLPASASESMELSNNAQKAKMLGDVLRQLDREHETDNINDLAFSMMPDITALQLINYVSKATELLKEGKAKTAREALTKAQVLDLEQEQRKAEESAAQESSKPEEDAVEADTTEEASSSESEENNEPLSLLKTDEEIAVASLDLQSEPVEQTQTATHD